MAATAQQEVESLDRVLTRLGSTDEGNLEKVSQLPRERSQRRVQVRTPPPGLSRLEKLVAIAIHIVCVVQVLSKLLPIVIAQLKSPHHQTKQKVRGVM